jgi:hypothetical protein
MIFLTGCAEQHHALLARHAGLRVLIGDEYLYLLDQRVEVHIADQHGQVDLTRVRGRNIQVWRLAARPFGKRAGILSLEAHPVAVLVLALAADQAH